MIGKLLAKVEALELKLKACEEENRYILAENQRLLEENERLAYLAHERSQALLQMRKEKP